MNTIHDESRPDAGAERRIGTGGAAGTGEAAAPSGPAQPAPAGYAPAAAPPWPQAQAPGQKSVPLAVLLSCMPGLGHIYIGYYQLGFLHFLIFVSLVTILASGAGGLAVLFGVSLAFFNLYNFVDAGRRAALYNQVLTRAAGQGPVTELPLNRGSTAAGVLLIVMGVVFLLHTRFDFDLYWLEEWWPVGLIGLGAYLFLKDRANRNATK